MNKEKEFELQLHCKASFRMEIGGLGLHWEKLKSQRKRVSSGTQHTITAKVVISLVGMSLFAL